ncbi:MAG: NAD-dependent succinate-semialdehyde dehydrogenase [Mycobacterium sp.]
MATPALHRLLGDVPTDLWIGGKQVRAHDGATFEVFDPATEERIATVADATVTDALLALNKAEGAQQQWSDTSPRQRADILRAAYELILTRSEMFAEIMTLEMGKALPESRAEVAYGAEFLRWFSEEAVRVGGRQMRSPAGNGQILVTKEPVGPVLAITPWNFPLAMGTRKIGPAFAAGCTVVVKPAEDTPLTMLLLGQVFADVGLPQGVLSILPTSKPAPMTAALMGDPLLRKVTFTGSTRVGQLLVRDSAAHLLRTSLELGGNAPFVVFADADIDRTLESAMAAKMRNGGEACTAANRFYVADSVAGEFVDKLTARMATLKVGHGLDPGVDLGPMVNGRQRDAVATLVADAVGRGAQVRTGGFTPDGRGFFYPPTVLDCVPPTARLLREEIFGPVAAITRFGSEEEAIAAANDTEYGLAAYIFTQDIDRALRVSQALDCGMVGINRGVLSDVAAPFGGVKASGIGREGGAEGIDEYLNTKYIAI